MLTCQAMFPPRRLNPLRAIERIAGAELREGEGKAVWLLWTALFFLLTAYYVLKVIREPLILVTGSAVSRQYARALQAGLLMGFVPLYAGLANRIQPWKLVWFVFTFFALSLLAFVGLGLGGLPVGFGFFVWLGIFSTLGIAQFWSLANDLFSEAQGKRLFPLIALGGTLGATVGAQIAARGIGALGPFGLMLVATGLIVTCIGLMVAGRRAWLERAREELSVDGEAEGAAAMDAPLRDRRGGFLLLLRDRYLMLIGGTVLLINMLNTTGDYVMAEAVSGHARRVAEGAMNPARVEGDYIGRFYGDFQTYVSILTATVQVFVVARLFRWIGVEGALFALPLLVLVGYGSTALFPVLAVISVVKVAENSTEYSLQNTIQQTLFLLTSRDAKYKAKTAIDTFLVRTGDLGSAGLVFAGAHMGLGVPGFALVNVAFAVGWLWIAARLAHHYRAKAAVAPATEALEGPK